MQLEELPLDLEKIIIDNKFGIEYSERLDKVKIEYSDKYTDCNRCGTICKKESICRGCVYGLPGLYERMINRREGLLDFDNIHLPPTAHPEARDNIIRRRYELIKNEGLNNYDDYISKQMDKLNGIDVEEFYEKLENDELENYLFPHFGGFIIIIIHRPPFMLGTTIYCDKISNILFIFYQKKDEYKDTKVSNMAYKQFPQKRLYKFCII